MSELKASFYDGKTSEKKEVQIRFAYPGELRISGLETDLTYALSDVRIAPRVANTPRSIYLPDGAKCETLDNDAIDAVLKRHRSGRWQAFLHRLESRLAYVLLALVITVVSVWGLIEYGVPVLAKHVAHSLPTEVDEALGRQGLSALDRALFSPSGLVEQRQRELRALFGRVTRSVGDEHEFRLEFRKSKRIGANALALPSGIVVLTDELVLLAEHENELVAILAHEIGHVVHRHALRRLLQDSATVLIVASITGDVTSITALSATLPTLLIEAKYSRDFEREADQFALAYLRESDIKPKHFADILLRLEKERSGGSETFDYLSSHPATKERVGAFQRTE